MFKVAGKTYKLYFHALQCFMPDKIFAEVFETVKSERLDRGLTTT